MGNQSSGLTIDALKLVRINEVTLKITDDTRIRSEGNLARWVGSESSRALAWVYNAGWHVVGSQEVWIARCGELAFGPTTFHRAVDAAKRMACGGFDLAVTRVAEPVAYLTRVSVELLSGEGF